MQLGELFSKTLRVDRPFGVFGLGWRRFLPKGQTASELDLLESAMAASTLLDHRGERGGSVPFLRAENVGRKPVLILDGEELSAGSRTGSSTPASSSSRAGAIDIPVCPAWRRAGGTSTGGTSRRARRCSGQVAGGAEGERRGKPGCGRKLPQRPGAVWREVSYSLRETQAPSPTSDYREGRAKVSRKIDSFVERVQPVDGQVGAIFLCARGILGLELLGEEDLFKVPAQDHPELRLRGAQRRISAACPKTWRPRGGRACRRPPVRAPLARGVTSGSTRAGNRLGTLLEPLPGPPGRAFGGGTRDPSERPGPGVPRRASAAAT